MRLLHEARLGARQASSSARIVHGGVRLPLCARVTEPGFAGLRRAFEGEAGSASAAVRTTGRWELEFARQTLLLSEVFDAVVLEGAGHLRDETDGLVQLNRLLREEAAAAGGRNVETWLERTPTAKIDASAKERPERVARAEARVRARWLATARIPGHGDRGEALAWFERGRAFDVARTLVNARVAGAHRVLLGRAARLPEDGRRSLAAFVRAEGQGRYTRRPAAWALEQAADRLGTPVRVEALPTSGRARTFRFTREPGNGPAWMVVVLPDPDRDWAGEPREAEKRGDVVLRIAPGLYSIQEVRISAEAPEVERRHVPDGVLRLDAGPSPIYVWPGR